MVEKLGLHKQVEFIDRLVRADALKAFADANLFLYPSFESGGIVALEAMALGVTIITLDYAGPGINGKSGWGEVVSLGSKKEVTRVLSHKIEAIENDYIASLKLAEEISLSVKEKFCWDNRHIEIAVWYSKLLEKQPKHVR